MPGLWLFAQSQRQVIQSPSPHPAKHLTVKATLPASTIQLHHRPAFMEALETQLKSHTKETASKEKQINTGQEENRGHSL